MTQDMAQQDEALEGARQENASRLSLYVLDVGLMVEKYLHGIIHLRN